MGLNRLDENDPTRMMMVAIMFKKRSILSRTRKLWLSNKGVGIGAPQLHQSCLKRTQKTLLRESPKP